MLHGYASRSEWAGTLEFRPLSACPSCDVVRGFVDVLQDYSPTPTSYDVAAFERRFHGEHLDRTASYMITRGSDSVAVVLVARRGWTSHISGMGVAPAWRRKGIGRAVLERVSDDARARGGRCVLLEVLERNGAAVGLYESYGFVVRRRLVGFARDPQPSSVPEPLPAVEVDLSTVAGIVACEGAPDLPWLLQPAAVYGFSHQAHAYEMDGKAYAVINQSGPAIALLSMIVRREFRRRGWGLRLLNALDAVYPARRWSIYPLVPEGLADAFLASFQCARLPEAQYEMELAL